MPRKQAGKEVEETIVQRTVHAYHKAAWNSCRTYHQHLPLSSTGVLTPVFAIVASYALFLLGPSHLKLLCTIPARALLAFSVTMLCLRRSLRQNGHPTSLLAFSNIVHCS